MEIQPEVGRLVLCPDFSNKRESSRLTLLMRMLTWFPVALHFTDAIPLVPGSRSVRDLLLQCTLASLRKEDIQSSSYTRSECCSFRDNIVLFNWQQLSRISDKDLSQPYLRMLLGTESGTFHNKEMPPLPPPPTPKRRYLVFIYSILVHQIRTICT